MLSLWLSHISKICEIFFCKEKQKSKLVTREFKHIQPQKRSFDGANRSLSVRVMNNSSRYAHQIIIIHAGTMKLGLS